MRALLVVGLLLLTGCREAEMTYAAPDAKAIEAAFRVTYTDAQANRAGARAAQAKRNEEGFAMVGLNGAGGLFYGDDSDVVIAPADLNGDLKARAKTIVDKVGACKWNKTEELGKFAVELFGVTSRYGWICKVDYHFDGLDRSCRRKTKTESSNAMFYVANGVWRYAPAYSFGSTADEARQFDDCARYAAKRRIAQQTKPRDRYR